MQNDRIRQKETKVHDLAGNGHEDDHLQRFPDQHEIRHLTSIGERLGGNPGHEDDHQQLREDIQIVLEGTLHRRIIIGAVKDDERTNAVRDEATDEPNDSGQDVGEKVRDPAGDKRDGEGVAVNWKEGTALLGRHQCREVNAFCDACDRNGQSESGHGLDGVSVMGVAAVEGLFSLTVLGRVRSLICLHLSYTRTECTRSQMR